MHLRSDRTGRSSESDGPHPENPDRRGKDHLPSTRTRIASGVNPMIGSAALRLHDGGTPAAGWTFDLLRDVTLIGRAPSCGIKLDERSVSRRHARIVRRDDVYYLEDLGSTAGTLLNDVRLARAQRLRD